MGLYDSLRGSPGTVAIIAAVLAVTVHLIASSGPGASCALSPPLGLLPFDCYVINMKKDKKRMAGFVANYNKTDLSKTRGLIRHNATVGKRIPIAEHTTSKSLCEILRAERTTYRQKHYELTRGAIGCWLSHRNLWRSVLDTDKECAMVFEDDCVVARTVHSVLKESQPPADWDIVLLGYICNECAETDCADMITVSRFFGLHCYMIHRRGIKKILANPKMNLITKQIDSVLCDMIRDGELNVYALPDPVAWQNNTDYATTIQMELRRVKGVDEWE